jgi:hypothetical protein
MPETQVEDPVARPCLLAPSFQTARCLPVKGGGSISSVIIFVSWHMLFNVDVSQVSENNVLR